MRHSLLASFAACLALTACGSTAQLQGQSASDGLSGTGSSSQSPTGLGAGGSSTSSGATAAGGSGSGSSSSNGLGSNPGATSTGAGSSSGNSTATSTTSGGPAAGAGKSANGKPGAVDIGIVIYPDVKQFATALGATGSGSPGDQKAEATQAITYVNNHGGLAGHRINPIFFEVSLTSTQTYAVTYQQICAAFTQDHHVAATVFIGNAEPALPTCLNKTHSLFLAHGHYLRGANDYAQLTNVVTPNDPNSDQVADAIVDQVVSRKLVAKGKSLGLIVMDYAAPQRAANQIIIPKLKAQGISTITYTVPYPQSTQDITSSASAVQSAELKMSAQGVKVVTFLCPGCVSFFESDAESQKYYPQYLVTSFDTVGGAKGQGHGQSFGSAIAIGWDPMRDVGTFTNPGQLAGNATHQLCKGIEKSNIVDDTSEFASEAFCGGLLDLSAAAKANPVNPLTGLSLLAGFDKLGSAHLGAADFSTLLQPNHHWGVNTYKTMHYDAGCDCFAYDNATLHTFS